MSLNPVRRIWRALAYAVATALGLGYSPVAPGTVGAAAAVGGAVLWFTAPDGKGDEPSAALVVGPGVVRAMGSF